MWSNCRSLPLFVSVFLFFWSGRGQNDEVVLVRLFVNCRPFLLLVLAIACLCPHAGFWGVLGRSAGFSGGIVGSVPLKVFLVVIG